MRLKQDQDAGRTRSSYVRWNVKLIFADGVSAREGTTSREPSNYSRCSSICVPASYEHFYLWEVLRNPISNVLSPYRQPIRLCSTLLCF